MKIRFLLLFYFFLPVVSICQGIRPSNIYRVTVTSSYEIERGERTSRFFAVGQELYDSLGRLHTEIDFNRETNYPDNYRWHYYDSLLLVRTEYFINEKPVLRVVYSHDESGVLTGEQHFDFSGDDPVLLKTIGFINDQSGLPVQLRARNSSGRILYRTRSVYDGSGTEISRRVRRLRGGPDDLILRLERVPRYDGEGRLASETVRLRLTGRNRHSYTRKYRYDDHDNITGIVELDMHGRQVSRIEYVWQQNRNRITRIIHYDSDDRLEKYLALRYEIYRTSDRRQRVIDY